MKFALPVDAGFSLLAAASFARAFPGTGTHENHPESLAFSWALDGDWRTVSVVLQHHGHEITGAVEGTEDPEVVTLVRRDVQRILCLDVDASGFAGVGRRDPVVGTLQE